MSVYILYVLWIRYVNIIHHCHRFVCSYIEVAQSPRIIDVSAVHFVCPPWHPVHCAPYCCPTKRARNVTRSMGQSKHYLPLWYWLIAQPKENSLNYSLHNFNASYTNATLA